MATLPQVQKAIAEIASHPRATRIEEIERVVRQLGRLGHRVIESPTSHGTLFTVDDQTFHVARHNRGSSHLKFIYVKHFIDAMAELGLCGDEE